MCSWSNFKENFVVDDFFAVSVGGFLLVGMNALEFGDKPYHF